ncbi:MAG: phenylalanine--tRNA ligase subunit beta [Candidatus Eremiobacteraeota bacterium]|nr:phenylalanine--tRNA ligase subunit beta [Candidatus Eremiobacteraeota bacterium]
MRVPLAWLHDFLAVPAPASDVAAALTERGFTVERIFDQLKLDRIVVGRIERLAPHPNADRLQISSVNVGGSKLQIVTGATNVSVGDAVPIALEGAAVFADSAGDGSRPQTKVIRRSTLRGVDSAGMMCSAAELALPGNFEDGILIMDPGARPGAEFWSEVGYAQAVLDVEIPSNRPDCLCIIGLAREASAWLGQPFREPFLEPRPAPRGGAKTPAIGVEIGDASVCRRLLGQHFGRCSNRRSPLWLALRLEAAGVRSISFLVDVSNYVQIETGQPLHFYDAAKIQGDKIVARAARAGETVITLDGVLRSLPVGAPVIADDRGPIGIAGIFGGAACAVDESTTEVFAESPNFVGPRVRRAAIALGLRTEGASRHERNLPLLFADAGQTAAAALLSGAGAVASAVAVAGEEPSAPPTIAVRPDRVNAVLGTRLDRDAMKQGVERIGFRVTDGAPMLVSVPWWRADIAEEIDVIEEVARGVGFDAIPERRSTAAAQDVDEGDYLQEKWLAQAVAALGYREIVSLGLQGSKTIAVWERSGLPFWTGLATIANPLSEDQRFLRPSLLPGLLACGAKAPKRGGGIFEIGHVFAVCDEGQTRERPSLFALVSFEPQSRPPTVDVRLLEVKGHVEYVVEQLTGQTGRTVAKPSLWSHPKISGEICVEDVSVALFGMLHPSLARAYELPASTYGFELFLDRLPKRRPVGRYRAAPRLPAAVRDIALVVEESITAGDLVDAARGAGVDALESARAFDEYRGPQLGQGRKSIALSLVLRYNAATITDAQADSAVERIVAALAKSCGARLRAPDGS